MLIPQTNAYDSPYLSLTNAPVTVNVYNDISYPNWVMEYSDDLLIVRISTAYQEADWEVPILGSEIFDLVRTFSGHTSNGQIEFTWDLRDTDGNKQEHESFYSEIHVYPTGAAGAAPAAPIVQVNPPLIKQFDNYPDEGKWTVARQDTVPGGHVGYGGYVNAMNSIANMAEQHGGVLPIADGVHRSSGQPMILRTNADWSFWFFNAVTNRTVRNFYYDGHGSPDSIGDDSGRLGAGLVSLFLTNSLNVNAPLGHTRYRFVWLDGCRTANGIWPTAFAMGKQENKPLATYAVRPASFCGFDQIIFFDPNYSAYRAAFVQNWHMEGRPLKEAFDRARVVSGWVGGGYLRVYGYWDLRASEFNRRNDWPPGQ